MEGAPDRGSAPAEQVTTARMLPHVRVTEGSLPPNVLVCGDPKRAARIASYWEEAQELAYHREYRLFRGVWRGMAVAACSHGVGAAGAAVAFEELIRAGARRIIRVGTAGSLQRHITDGDLVVATAAVREDGLTPQLVPLPFPAVADRRAVAALEAASRKLSIPVHVGPVLTVAAFYPGLLGLPNRLYSDAGVLAVEMEVAALFVVASLRGVGAGAVVAIDGMAIEFDAHAYDPHRERVARAVDQAIELALEALRIWESWGAEGVAK